MPETVGALILTAVGASATSTLFTVGTVTVSTAVVVGTIAITAASIGIQVAVASAMRPSAPRQRRHRPELTTEQKVSARFKSYGFVRIGGHKIFEESTGKAIHRLLAVNEGQIDSFARYYLGERRVGFGTPTTGFWGSGLLAPINGPRYNPGAAGEKIFMDDTKLGSPTQLVIDALTSSFPGEIDTNFRVREQALFYLVFRDASNTDFLRVYPNHIPEASVAIKASRVYDMRTGGHSATDKATWAYRENSILCYLDALRCPDLCYRSSAFTYAPIAEFNTTSFQAAADVCDENVVLKAGGAEKRYTVATTLTTDMRPADIERVLLSSCDGWSYLDSDGLVAVLAGKWIAPTVTLSKNAITGFSMQIGPGQEDALNVLKPTIDWPDNQFQETECPPWKDTADIALRGAEYPEVIEFPTTSYTQAQRLSKIAVKRALALQRGTVTTNLRGEVAAGHRFITLDLPWLEQAITVEVLRFFRISGPQPGCRIEFVAMSSTAWDWAAATEEGTKPIVTNEGDDFDQQIDRPSALTLTDSTEDIQFAWNNPTSIWTRKAEMEWRLQSAGTANLWRRKTGTDNLSPQISDSLIDGDGTYEGRMRYRIGNHVVTDWTPLNTVVVTTALDLDAIALYARMTTTPTAARKTLISNLIKSLKSAGVWTKLDALWVLAAADSQAALLNWKSTSFTPTAVSAPTFTADRGFTGNGTSSYLDMNYNPATAGGVYVLDSAHLGVWNRTDIGENVAEAGNQNTSMLTRNAAASWVSRLNSATNSSVANANGSGHHVLSRQGSTQYERYRTGVALAAAVVASSSITSSNIWACGKNITPPDYSTDQVAAVHAGSGLTATNVTDFYNALQTYMTGVGA